MLLPKVPSIAQTIKPHKTAWQLIQTRLQRCGELDFPCLKQSFAGNTTAASNALCEQSCCLEEAPGKQQHPTQPARLPSRPNLNRDCWNISKRKFKNKTKAPGATRSSSSSSSSLVSAGSRGQPPITRLLLIHMHGSKLNVSGARQPEGTLLPRTKGGALGYSRHRPARCRGGKGSPHTGMGLWAPSCSQRQLQAGEAGESKGQPAVSWGLEAPVQLPQCCCSNHQHSHTCGVTVSIFHPSNIFQKLGGDLKTIPIGDGCFEPNSLRESGMGKGLQNIFPPKCGLDSPLSPTGNTLLVLGGRPSRRTWATPCVTTGDFIIKKDNVTFFTCGTLKPQWHSGHRDQGTQEEQLPAQAEG